MTFENAIEDWESHDDWRYADRDAERKFFYLAGQASAEQRVKELNTLCEFNEKTMEDLLAKNAELERERDQWKYTAEIRQQHLEYTIKAQAGEPIYGMAQQRQLNPSPQVRSDVGSLGNTHPTTEPVKAQAGEPTYTTGHCENHKHPKGCQLHNLHCGYPACDRKAATHPTTERRVPEDENLRMALENCRLLAARHRKEDWALLILGFCAEGGVVGSVMR